MIFELWDDGKIADLDFFEEFHLQDILLDFLNYDSLFWLDSDIGNGSNAREHYLNELIGGFLHPPLIKNEKYTGEGYRSYNINLSKNKYKDLENFKLDLIEIINKLSNDETDINYSFPLDEVFIKNNITIRNGVFSNIYEINRIDAYCIFALLNLSQRDLLIKKCANCGDFFVPTSRSDEQYCNKVLNNNRTCKEVGWENKPKPQAYDTYRKSYSKNYNLLRRNKNTIDKDIYEILIHDFNKWNNGSKYYSELTIENEFSFEDYERFLKDYDTKLRYLLKYIKDGAEISTKDFRELLNEYEKNINKEDKDNG